MNVSTMLFKLHTPNTYHTMSLTNLKYKQKNLEYIILMFIRYFLRYLLI